MKGRIVLLCLGLLSGCAGHKLLLPAADTLFHDALFAAPAQAVRAQDVLALSAPMKQYLETTVAAQLRARGPQRGLVDALFAKGQLRLDYDADRTRNAAEAFEARAGNCLSLVLMTASFARELGLLVRYQVVETPAVWDRSGDLVLHVGHINVALGRPTPVVHPAEKRGDWLTIDFMPSPEDDRSRAWPISEDRVLALYMNNRAAEALAGGQLDEAYWWVRGAIVQDPRHDDAFNTLGVVYMRRGQADPAEAALRRALALDSENPHALGNLANLLRRLGREAEANEIAARLRRVKPIPPFRDFAAGMEALRAGDYPRARDLLEREVPRVNGHHEVHFGLALAYAHLGDAVAAARHLNLARENSPTRQQQALYAAKLDRLRATPVP